VTASFVLLFVIGWFLTRELSSNQKIEDWAPIEAPATY
jgi:hypothetical protein